jgi:hypothetical protein
MARSAVPGAVRITVVVSRTTWRCKFSSGKRILSVEATNYNTIKFVLADGQSVTLTPSGIEGDDLDLTIATEAGI